MSLLDLLYFQESKTDTVITAVRQWCAENGCNSGSEDGNRAIEVAVRLAKSAAEDGSLFASLSAQMTEIADRRGLGLIIVIEDEPLIAMDLEQTLQNAGFRVETFVSCADAMTWLANYSPTAAVLDIRLRDGSCADVAKLLEDRGIPFLVSSGSEKADVDPIFFRGEWMSKPCDPDALVKAATTAVERSLRGPRMEVTS